MLFSNTKEDEATSINKNNAETTSADDAFAKPRKSLGDAFLEKIRQQENQNDDFQNKNLHKTPTA